MKLSYVFLAFALAAGVAVGAALVVFPAFRTLNIPPYFLILLALAVFDGICFWRGGGTPGSVVSMPVRFAGLVIGALAVSAVGYLAGIEVRYF